MSFQFIEVTPSEVLLDQAEVERDDGFVYEHLKRYCSKFTPLPAITVKAVGQKLTAVRGQKYLAIARELGHERIRAVSLDGTFDQLKARGVRGLLCVVPTSQLEQEERATVITGWHVLFFRSRPSAELAEGIRARFDRFANETLPTALPPGTAISIESHFDSSGPCLEIKFPTPVANEEWAKSYYAFLLAVSSELALIETYQGRRFG